MAMEEPWPRIVRHEADGCVVSLNADGHCIALDWIIVVVSAVTRAAHDVECMLS